MSKPIAFGSITTALLAAVSLIAVGVVAVSSNIPHRRSHTRVMTVTNSATLVVKLGLDPDSLAAAGINDQQVVGLFTHAGEFLVNNQTTFDAAVSELGDADAALLTLQDKARSGKATEQELGGLGSATSRAQSAHTQYNSLLASARSVVTADLTDDQRGSLETIRQNRGWGLPTKYLAVHRTQAQWVALREALDTKRINEERGRSVDSQAAEIVSSANAESAVTTAAANLQVNSASVTAAWSSAVNPH